MKEPDRVSAFSGGRIHTMDEGGRAGETRSKMDNVRKLYEKLGEYQVVDVREPWEWRPRSWNAMIVVSPNSAVFKSNSELSSEIGTLR